MAQAAASAMRYVQLGLAQINVEVLVVGIFTSGRRQAQHLQSITLSY